MKKVKNKMQYNRLSKRRFEKKIKRKKHKKELIKLAIQQKKSILNVKRNKLKLHKKANAEDFIELKPPSHFSIIENPNETLTFFESLESNLLNYDPIYINMSEISRMTVDALLYYISILQHIKTKLSAYILKGSFPEDEETLTLMKRSGFLRYFKTSEDNINTHRDYVEIKSGNIADNQVVKDICLFVMEKMKVGRVKTQKLYDIIFEMMLNTKQHAYNANTNKYDNWLLFLKFNPDKSNIEFIFLDKGFGIPQTVRKNKLEIAVKWFSKIGITEFSETDLVDSALKGAFRTKTEKGYRGKGLPKINQYFENGYIKSLNIISKKACITAENKHDLEKEIIGTLYSWKITKDSINGNNNY
ncbi:hypothetical protein [Desulfotalea psychrophila]|uniref:Uncharacterized protein n=1 Tax=Desulfotalea psychrophila (strain LSv54 / DSM 12343) TaxID=177439 RepID=Q6AM64_DESPS|nr:hypothetical protein [Desulfotalea psychrophila]CAG36561.1 unknown protein [Desulfotalea psychrophila LSv54]